MALGRQQKREVVTRVVDGCAHNNSNVPEPGNCKMRPGYDRSGCNGCKVHNIVFQRMAVDGCHAHWCSPFVVCLVHIFVELWMMKEPTLQCCFS